MPNVARHSSKVVNEQFGKSNSSIYKIVKTQARAETRQCAPPPPRNHLSKPSKNFTWMVIQKSKPRRGNAKLGGSGGIPPKNFAKFDLILEAFLRFEPLKFHSFNKV